MTAQLTRELTNDLELTPTIFNPTLYLEKVQGSDLLAAPAADGSAYSIEQRKGRIRGVGVRVSGLGAYARAKGSMTFSQRMLETSRTYQEMRKSYNFSAGVSGFWSWIGLGANASVHKQELTQVFNELKQEEKTDGKIEIDLYVTGMFPNVPVSAEAYIMAFQVSSKTGSFTPFAVLSDGAPTRDTGAQDQNGQNLPVKNNNSTIDI